MEHRSSAAIHRSLAAPLLVQMTRTTIGDVPHTYLLECADGTFYAGSTFDLDRRVAQHMNGEGAVYTRSRRPVRLIWNCEFDSIRAAYHWEKQIQGWSHAKRLALVEGRFDDLPRLARTAQPARTASNDGRESLS